MPTAGDPLALGEARRVGVVGLAVAAAVTVFSIVGTIGAPDPLAGDKALVTTGDHPHGPVAVLLDRSDGQTFAALARDPLLSRPQVFREGRDAAAYRAQRPLFAYLGWALALGRPSAVGWALFAVSAIAAGLAAWAAALEIEARGGVPLLGVFVVLIPGVLVALRYATAEAVGLALVLWALHWWRARPWLAGVLLAAAGLTRETLLVVVLALGVEAVHRRDRRRCGALGVAVVPYAVWVFVVRLRFRAWPWQGETVRTTRPLLDLAQHLPRTSATMLIIAITLGVAAVVVRPRDVLSHVAAAHVLVVVGLGRETLAQWPSVDRVLVPLWATAFIVCGSTWSASTQPAATERRASGS